MLSAAIAVSGNSVPHAVPRLAATAPPPSHAGHELAVVLAVVMVAVGGLILLGLGLRRRLSGGRSGVVLMDATAPRRSVQRAVVGFAALLSLAAAVLHGAAVAGGAGALDADAGILVAATIVQTGFAAGILVSQRRGLVLAGIAVNATLVALWLAGTIGLAATGFARTGSGFASGSGEEAVAAVFAMLLVPTLAWLAYCAPSLTDGRARQLRSAISIAAVPSVGVIVLATLLVISAGPSGQIPA